MHYQEQQSYVFMFMQDINVDFWVAWEVLQALGFRVWGGKAPQESLVGLEPKHEVLHQIVFWGISMEHFELKYAF